MLLGRDGIAGLIGLTISIGLLPVALQLPKLPIVPVGPGFYAIIVLAFLGGASAILVVQDVMVRRAKRSPSPDGDAGAPSASPAFGLVLAAFSVVGGYVALLPNLGFRISTVLFVAVFQGLLDPPRGLRHWAVLIAIALGTSAITYTLFEQYLSVLLPRGHWTNY